MVAPKIAFFVPRMTTSFPRLGSPELKPYEAPFGRFMLAYGRVIAALIELATVILGDELKAAKKVTNNSGNLPTVMTRMLAGRVANEEVQAFTERMKRLAEIADRRNHLVHGEWWFDVFEDGVLCTRKIQRYGRGQADRARRRLCRP